MMGQAKGASLDPATHSKGGAVPDGDYVIKRVVTDLFDYNGTRDASPALLVLYADPNDSNVTYEQAYTAGTTDRLVPSDDKRRFVHPRGESAVIAGGSNVSLWLGSILKAGFPTARMSGDDVTVFEGCKVTVTNVAQPTRAGLKDQKEGKTIPLITKVISLPGEKVTRPTKVAAPAVPGTSPSTTAAAPAVATPSNGDVSDIALASVLEALQAAPEHTLKVKGLAVRCLKYAQGTKLNDLTKTITLDWLNANSETAGWTVSENGEGVSL